MAKNKKDAKKLSKLNVQNTPGIRFELEEDARDLMLQHLLLIKPEQKDTHCLTEVRKNRSRDEKAKKVIDLHGLNLIQAFDLLRERISLWLSHNGTVEVRVITGKGYNSDGGNGVLSKEIHKWILREYEGRIVRIEESPDKTKINKVPLRGHFDVVLRR